MIMLGEIPFGLQAVIDVYGNPDSDGDHILDISWVDHNLTVFDLPFPMRLSWSPLQTARRIQAHKAVGPVMVDALHEIMGYKGWLYLQENDFDMYGGCFNFRLKRGGSELSMHSFGIAIDINPHLGALGETNHRQPQFIVSAFIRRGFEWGGNWGRCDSMHYQAATGV